MRRPKHTILHDTILTLKRLQAKLANLEQQPPASALHKRATDGGGLAASFLCPPGPSSQHADWVTGIQVDQTGPSTWLLRVTCPGRQGLLEDILGTLRPLPLIITNASMVTNLDLDVQNLFELQALDSSVVCAEDVRRSVQGVVAVGCAATPPALGQQGHAGAVAGGRPAKRTRQEH